MVGSVSRFAEGLLVSALETALDRVRSFKEEVKMNEVKSTWKCPVCGDTGFKTAAGAKTHMTRQHKTPYDVLPIEEKVPVELAAIRAEREKAAKVIVPVEKPVENSAEKPAVKAPAIDVELGVAVFKERIERELNVDLSSPVVMVTPEVVARVEPPLPPPVMMPVVVSQLPDEIPVGAVLDLNVPTWKKAITTWEVGYPVHQQVSVVSRETGADGSAILVCDGEGTWSVPESAVLTRVVTLVSIPDNSAALEAERIRKEKMDEFRVKRDTYVAAREAAKGPQATFEKVRAEYRDFLMGVVREFGSPSKSNQNTLLLESDDYMCMVSTTRPDSVVEYNKERIEAFLMENGFDDYLTPMFDEAKWADLKEMKFRDSGLHAVPREFIQEVERLREFDAVEALRIDPLAK
jgi:hypothetical protein